MTVAPTMEIGSVSGDERWRTLAEATAGDFAAAEGDTLAARVAAALARLFGGAALVLDGVGDDAAVVVRGPAGGPPVDAVAASAVAMARVAAQQHRMLREEAGGGEAILAAPLRGRAGPSERWPSAASV